jgi:hypothetical protein
MDIIKILIGLLLYPFRFLIGLSSIWFEERNSKTVIEMLKEYDVQVIGSRSTLSAFASSGRCGSNHDAGVFDYRDYRYFQKWA